MKKLVIIIAALTMFVGSARADEGMWLLPLLEKMNGKALSEAGCELTPKQIYDINNTSLKDAIVQFGGGCTGEIISKDGLLVTNHHCGYGSIQKLSSVEHDYLKDGFWAMNRSEELPCEGLSVTFLEYMQDVTPALEKAEKKALKALKGQEDTDGKVMEAVQKKIAELVEDAEKNGMQSLPDVTINGAAASSVRQADTTDSFFEGVAVSEDIQQKVSYLAVYTFEGIEAADDLVIEFAVDHNELGYIDYLELLVSP